MNKAVTDNLADEVLVRPQMTLVDGDVGNDTLFLQAFEEPYEVRVSQCVAPADSAFRTRLQCCKHRFQCLEVAMLSVHRRVLMAIGTSTVALVGNLDVEVFWEIISEMVGLRVDCFFDFGAIRIDGHLVVSVCICIEFLFHLALSPQSVSLGVLWLLNEPDFSYRRNIDKFRTIVNP